MTAPSTLVSARSRTASLVRSRWLRALIGIAILVVIALHVGTAAFARGLAALTFPVVMSAVLLGAVATVASAWRWRAVAHGFGVRLEWSTAVAHYYRSQFLNSVLPGGVLGDVHRAVDHGSRTRQLGAVARSVAVERGGGQLVQLAAIGALLLSVQAPDTGIGFAALAIGAMLVIVVSGTALVPAGRRLLVREARTLGAALRSPVLALQVVISSLIVLACHAATLVIATAAVGTEVPLLTLLPLTLSILAAASVPVNVGGWGPREGAAAWVFAAAGYTAGDGVATATLFGVVSLIALIPGVLWAGIVPAQRTPYGDRSLSSPVGRTLPVVFPASRHLWRPGRRRSRTSRY